MSTTQISAAEYQEKQIKMAEELLFTEKHKASFAKLLYFGIFDSERVFPFPEPGQAERKAADDFLAGLREYCDKHLDPVDIDREARIPDDVVLGLGKTGLLRMTVPAAHGGLGRTQYAYCRAMEEIGSRCGGTAVFVNAHHSIGLRALVLFGTKAQQQKWLPKLGTGETLAAFALTEPNAGSDAANVQTRAVFDPQKNCYIINGEKQWITNGGISGVLTLMARTDIKTANGVEDKITAFLVTPDMPGFKVENARLEKFSIRGTATAKLSFKDMPVPAENILGKPGGGLKIALTTLDFGRLTFGASCTGAAKELTKRSIEHAKTRIQFQRPIGSFGLVKEKLVKMASMTFAMESTTYLTAGLLDAGEGDFMLETALLKVFTSDCLWYIAHETVQVLGGKAFFFDQPYERMFRDARLNLVGEGANEVLRVFIGLGGMRDVGKELEAIVKSFSNPLQAVGKVWDFGTKQAGKFFSTPTIPVESPLLLDEAKQLGAAVRKFGMAVQRCLGKHREGILEQQKDVDRISTACIAIYSMSAVISRLDADLRRVEGRPEALGHNLSLGKYYCADAIRTLDAALGSLFDPFDAKTEALADKLTGLAKY